MSQQPQECHLYQLFPPTLPPSPPSPPSPLPSPLPPPASPSPRRMRGARVPAPPGSPLLHAGLKFVEVTERQVPRFGVALIWWKCTITSCVDRSSRLPPASCCSCLASERTSKCLTPSCPRWVWTSQTCWTTVRTQFWINLFPFVYFRIDFLSVTDSEVNLLCLQLWGSAASVRLLQSGSVSSVTKTWTSLQVVSNSTARPATHR